MHPPKGGAFIIIWKMRDNRNLKTVLRDNVIHEAANAILAEAGEYASDISRTSLYLRVAKRTGYKRRKIQETLNHTIYIPRDKLYMYE